MTELGGRRLQRSVSLWPPTVYRESEVVGSPYDGFGGEGGRFIVGFLDEQDVSRSGRR
jgi:hypothetical protein